jgi:hypothetical protein
MIRERILGVWSLILAETTLPDGRIITPMGANARGRIIYSPEGYVSVNLMNPDRARATPEKVFRALSDADIAPLARGYMAYSGPFEIDESKALARHHFDLCLDAALIGTLQERRVRFIGDDQLELSLRPGPGAENPSRLLWKRDPKYPMPFAAAG